MTTLISFLGKSSDNPSGYRTANYRFDAQYTASVPFFGMALQDYIQAKRLVLVGTPGSMWDVFFGHRQTGGEVEVDLMVAAANNAVTAAVLSVHEQRLTAKLGIPVTCLLISYARNETEQSTILADLARCLQPGEKVTLDVTHGFRHLPMLALVAARYLQRVRDVDVQELYYGALEMTDQTTGETPVLRLGAMLHILDWVEGLATYDNSGNYGVFAPLLERDGMAREHVKMLAQGSFHERNSNPLQARQALTGALNHVREYTGPLGSLFRDKLAEHIGWFRDGSRHEWELKLADRYLACKDYLRATTYLYESHVSHAVWRERGNPSNHEDRETARRNAGKDQNVKLLTYLRNAMVHGVRTDDNHYDKKIKEEVQRLLEDQEALDARLHKLRRTLARS